MRRVRWKRKDAFVQTCSKRKFGECGSQLFCSEICFLLRGTGGVRISFSLVHRADSHMKPRDANRTPSASFSAAALYPLGVVSKGGGRGPRPLCRWGSRAKSKRPGAFLPGCGAGSFPEKNAPHVLAVGTAPCGSKGNVGDIPMGKAHFRIRSRMVSPCFPVPQSGTRVYDLVK